MKHSFNAWKEGAFLYGLPIFLGITACAFGWMSVGVVLLAGGFAIFLFFRDPPRKVDARPNEIVSPADGTVVAIEELEQTPHYDGPCMRVSVFLSLFDVHINRAPEAGTVRETIYRPGKFKNAMKPETSECNESNTIKMDTEHGPMTVRQISGAVARRIVCLASEGDALEKGQKFGMIRFGSRTELYLPPGSTIRVALKDRVRAGTTIMAEINK